MKKWWFATILALFPITGLVGAHHVYLDNIRKFLAYVSLIFGTFTIMINPEIVTARDIPQLIGITKDDLEKSLGPTTFLFLTLLCWYNAYGFIRFGVISVNKRTDFWNDTWKINWNKDIIRKKKNSAKYGEEFSNKYFEGLNLTPEEEKRRRENMGKYGSELLQKLDRGEYDEELGKLDGEYEGEQWWDEFHAANQEEKGRMYSDKFESKEWWDEFSSAEPEKRRKMSKEKISADSAASGSFFIHNR